MLQSFTSAFAFIAGADWGSGACWRVALLLRVRGYELRQRGEVLVHACDGRQLRQIDSEARGIVHLRK